MCCFRKEVKSQRIFCLKKHNDHVHVDCEPGARHLLKALHPLHLSLFKLPFRVSGHVCIQSASQAFLAVVVSY